MTNPRHFPLTVAHEYSLPLVPVDPHVVAAIPGVLPPDDPRAPREIATWIGPGYDVPVPVWSVEQAFLDAVHEAAAAMGFPWTVGTFAAVRSDAPTTHGTWHVDAGAGVRFVAAAGVPGCGQEFRGGVTPDGALAVYTRAEHRRPLTGPWPRVFLTAALYVDPVDVVLDCRPLRALAATAPSPR